jgi:FKBP-type peptidyl-prolyl cis-trans isomerase
MDRTNKSLIIGVLVVLIAGYLLMRWNQESPPAPAAEPTPAATAAPDSSKSTPAPTTANATKLQKTDLIVGKGKTAKTGDHVVVNYRGMLTNGTVFDESYKRGQPFDFTLGGDVIKGWNEGIVGMKEGGKRKLVIPPDLGYGARGAGDAIPPNATLIFEVELIKVG